MTTPGRSTPLFRAIVDDISKEVVSGGVGPGDALPSERELSEQYGVSRTVVREAIKVLSEKRLVTVIRGKGVVAAHPSPDTVTASLGVLFRLGRATPHHLTELRRGIEPEAAALAAMRATPEQLQRLRLSAENYAHNSHHPERATELDLELHWTIAEATQNELIKAMLGSIQGLYRETMMSRGCRTGSKEKTVYYHYRIVDAIEQRDPEAARLFMLHHIDQVHAEQLLAEERRNVQTGPESLADVAGGDAEYSTNVVPGLDPAGSV